MAVSTVIKNFRDGGVVFSDATGTPLTCTVLFDLATFTVSGLNATNHETIVYEFRGEFQSIRKGKRTYPTFTLSCAMSELSDVTNQNVYDFVNRLGAFGSAVSTSGANADVFTAKVTLTIEGTTYGDASDHVLVLNDCRLNLDSFAEGDPNTFTISGVVYGSQVAT